MTPLSNADPVFDGVRDAIRGAGRKVSARRGSILMRQNDRPDCVLLVERGLTRVAVDMANGKEVVLALRGKGELIGEFAAISGRPRSATITTLTDLAAVSVTAGWFHALLRDHTQLSFEIMRRLVHRIDESDRRRMEAGTYAVPQRLARLLYELATAHGRPTVAGGVELSRLLTQDELGSAIGATRESVVRALRQLRGDGVVSTSRRRITVLRLDLLDARTDPLD